jgi:hypothetical protein
MVVDRSAKVLKLAPGRRGRTTLAGVFAAAIAIDVGQRIGSERL